MNTWTVLGLLVALFLGLAEYRSYLVYKVRVRMIDEDFRTYLKGPGYFAMFFDIRKWTYRQFWKKK